MLLRNGSSDRMGKGSFGLIGKHHFIIVYNPNKKQTLILVGIVMWLKTYFRHGFQNLTTNKVTWQISNKNSNNTRYKKENENGLDISCEKATPTSSTKPFK